MKKIHKNLVALILISAPSLNLYSQCATTNSTSSANNMYGLIRNSTNPVVVDKELNTIVFLHRQNTSQFAGNAGNLRYDISTDAGSTWTTNIGVLNPASNLSQARYPNAVIYNPPANTNTSNAYLGYLAATTNTNNATWGSINTGGRFLNGTGNSELYNQANVTSNFIAGSMVKGAPGIFWAMDETSNGTNTSGGLQVYKGVWSSTSNSINWTLNTTLTPPYNPNSSFTFPLGEYYIAFDPTGNIGWVAVITDITTNFNDAFQPVFYKTVNGGATWTGPTLVNLTNIPCINNNVFVPGSDTDCNLVVDIYGNPHLLGIFGEANLGGIDEFDWHAALDITFNGNNWIAYDVSGINGGPATITSNPNNIEYRSRPQVARTSDGKKIFFTWTDNSSYSLGTSNNNPNLFGKAIDIQTLKWTPIKDFTSCNANTASKIFYPHIAKEVLEPVANTYKIAAFYGEFTSPLDADMPANYRFLNNVVFTASEFSISVTNSLNLTVLPKPNPLLCPGNNLSLQISGTFNNIFWSNGSTNNFATVNTPGIYTVTASSGCSTGSSTINVTTATMTISPNNSSICSGSSVTLNATGNAYGYTWTPGGVSNSIIVTPTITTNYLVVGSGDGCSINSAVSVTVLPAPSLIAVSNKTITCAGEEIIIQAIGPNILVWSTSAVTTSISVTPTLTTTYSVTGTNSNGCSATYAVTQLVNPCTDLISMASENNPLQIYPNPNNGNFEISASSDLEFSIINSLGQIMGKYSINSENNKLSVHHLSQGVYFVRGKTINGTHFNKTIVVNP